MNDLISRQMAIDAMISQNGVVDKSVAKRILIQLPSVEPSLEIVKTMLKELEQKEERLYSDYRDTTARLKAINKIAKSNQTPKRKIDGIKSLAELEVGE